MPRITTLGFALGLVLLTPLAAGAMVVTGTFGGVLSGGTDTNGVFGTAGGDLSGQNLIGAFTYDTSLLSGPVGGPYRGTGPGAITATLTMNSITYTFADLTSSSLYLDPGSSEVTVQTASSGTGTSDTFYLDAADFLTPFVTSGDPAQQSFVAPVGDPFFTALGSFQVGGSAAYGDFTLTSLSVAPASVPEPGSWVLIASPSYSSHSRDSRTGTA